MLYYRLVFKDGSHSTWDSDYNYVYENAKFFGVTIESKWFGA